MLVTERLRDRFAIAEALREIGLLLSLKGENRFRARAYERGAEAIEQLEEDFDKLVKNGGLTEIEGVGAGLASVIEELYRTGASKQLERLRNEVPKGLIELSQIDGLTEKRIEALRKGLKIESVDELRAALESGAIKTLKGFGPKTEEKIRAGLERYDRGEERILLIDALDLGARFNRWMASATEQQELVGELRRWHEAVPSIDLIAAGNAAKILKRAAAFPEVTRVEEEEPSSVVLRAATGATINVNVVSRARMGAALIVHTGSPEHVTALQKHAVSKGLSLAEIEGEDEAAVYEKLGLPHIPPEQRESGEEVQRAARGDLQTLIDLSDVRGVVHCHTTYSDGKHTVEQMAKAADALGFEYLTITDHSPSAYYASGLTIDRLKEQWDEIARVQELVKVKLLRGTESDILADGSLDYPDQILENLDVVIASIHSRFQMDADAMTARITRAMALPVFKIWGHGLGRLVLKRDPIRCDMEKVLDTIASSPAAIEVNGDPYRLDLEPRWIKEARKRGIKFVISVDAHSTGAIEYLPFGVHMARRGGLTKSEVLNTLPVSRFKELVKPA